MDCTFIRGMWNGWCWQEEILHACVSVFLHLFCVQHTCLQRAIFSCFFDATFVFMYTRKSKNFALWLCSFVAFECTCPKVDILETLMLLTRSANFLEPSIVACTRTVIHSLCIFTLWQLFSLSVLSFVWEGVVKQSTFTSTDSVLWFIFRQEKW